MTYSAGAQANKLPCGVYGGGRGVNSAPIKFVFALDAYEELIQIREEGVANFFQMILRLILAVGYQQENKPPSVFEPAGERKLLPSKRCWQ